MPTIDFFIQFYIYLLIFLIHVDYYYYRISNVPPWMNLILDSFALWSAIIIIGNNNIIIILITWTLYYRRLENMFRHLVRMRIAWAIAPYNIESWANSRRRRRKKKSCRKFYSIFQKDISRNIQIDRVQRRQEKDSNWNETRTAQQNKLNKNWKKISTHFSSVSKFFFFFAAISQRELQWKNGSIE